MSDLKSADLLQKATQWWSTEIIDMKPGVIQVPRVPDRAAHRKGPFPQMIWLMLKGDLPTPDQAKLLEAALVAAVDHGPQAPSIAIGRMAVTCGLPLNGAMASAINVLDDVHGGAGEQCMELYFDIARRMDGGAATRITRSSGGWTASSRNTARSFPGSATAFIQSIRARRAFSNSLTQRVTGMSYRDVSRNRPRS